MLWSSEAAMHCSSFWMNKDLHLQSILNTHPPNQGASYNWRKNVLQFTLSLIRQFVTLIRSVWSESLQCTMFSARWSSCVCGNMREDPGNKPHLLLALFFAKTILSPFIFVARRYPQSYWILLSFPTISFQARALRALGLLLADGAPTVGGGKTFWRVSQIFLQKQL